MRRGREDKGDVNMGGQMAERLGNRAIKQKVAGSISRLC